MNLFKNKNDHCNQGHSPVKHMIHMILCCGLPLLILLALPFIAGISPAAAGFLGVISPFICPVMMGGMLLMMMRGNKSSCCNETKEDNNQELPHNN